MLYMILSTFTVSQQNITVLIYYYASLFIKLIFGTLFYNKTFKPSYQKITEHIVNVEKTMFSFLPVNDMLCYFW